MTLEQPAVVANPVERLPARAPVQPRVWSDGTPAPAMAR
jgi:hypothetical protein